LGGNLAGDRFLVVALADEIGFGDEQLLRERPQAG
jgi:hypothetical protein